MKNFLKSKLVSFVAGALFTGAAVGNLNQGWYAASTLDFILGTGLLIHTFVSYLMDGGK